MPEVESPDGEYSVSTTEVWDVLDVPDDARDVSDEKILQRIKESMIIVEDAAGPDASADDRKTVVKSMTGRDVLDDAGDQLVSSMDALDVSIEYDVEAKRERLDSRTDKLLAALREKGKFVFRSI